MPLIKLPFKPGVNREVTNYSQEGGWVDSDKVRFVHGFPEKIGGWTRAVSSAFQGVCRLLFNWVTLTGVNHMVVGTHKRFYVEAGGVFNDITPIRETLTQSNAITAVNGSTTLTFSTGATAHNASVGDFVVVSGATTTGGILASGLNAEHTITSVPTTTTFTVTSSSTATSSETAGGSVTMEFLFGVGQQTNVFGTGWGAGYWSRGTWGSAATSTVSGEAMRLWSADNFGEDLLFCARHGPLFVWDASAGPSTRATYVADDAGASDVPTEALMVLVTPERFVLAFGCTPIGGGASDPLLFRWASQETYTDWSPSTSDTAGDLRLSTGSYIVTALKARSEILVWTDAALHSLQYLGPPFHFGQTTLAHNVTVISPNAAIAVNNAVYWMGKNQFYVYNGQVATLPCTVQSYVFDDLDTAQAFQIYCGLNEPFGEVTWFYCGTGSSRMDKYVTFNYLENLWYYGTMDRTAWLYAPTRGVTPFATGGGYDDEDGYLYAHESGNDASEDMIEPMEAYVTSADIDIGDGENFMFVDKVLPDFDFSGSSASQPEVDVTVSARNTPGGLYLDNDARQVTRSSTSPVTQFTQQLWMRLRGRHMQVKISSDTAGVKWRLGSLRLQAREEGKR
jgi:hypothetical protein